MKHLGFFLLIILVSWQHGCNSETDQTDMQTMKYLALGDSYTIGERVSEQKRFPVQLVDTLRVYWLDVNDPEIIATTGWTTDELAAGIEEANITGPYDLVTLLIGVNNQYRGRSVENFREEYVELLEQAIAFAGGHPEKVVVISIPDWGVTPFAEGRDREQIAQEIDAYNAAKMEETMEKGVSFINVTPISRQAAEQPELIAEDGLHPSGAMYKLWVDLMFNEAKAAITFNP
ncbi:GDSL-like Lipase/Acylhydrolase [Salinivirga cyanobacteriivorans]|uniref:GDSL-like Lipase/Acylhydrolase n=1 Tax=Salinivirga cyanobacteriivorans TaxID=1307839 RepID=A0A0S2HX12_9BACT|nr:SGNH/GDSL hydrolase family protein [Salinivirga cyanobacteriivorans]ALO14615.1 GDSL-like Lipase/Acylhydrolase [Salinivirga cyanobacteriivorans]